MSKFGTATKPKDFQNEHLVDSIASRTIRNVIEREESLGNLPVVKVPNEE
jgi:hypothetical protein